MSRIILLALAGLLVSSLDSEAGGTQPIVISIDRDENTYLDNVQMSDMTQLAQIHAPALYIRVDKDTRFQAMCRVLAALPNGAFSSLFLGTPRKLGRREPLNLTRGIEEMGSLRVTTKTIGSSWASEPTSTHFTVDFDGSITSNITPYGVSLDRTTADRKLAERAVKEPRSHIYIGGNDLSKVDTIETLAVNASRRGFTEITIVCRVS